MCENLDVTNHNQEKRPIGISKQEAVQRHTSLSCTAWVVLYWLRTFTGKRVMGKMYGQGQPFLLTYMVAMAIYVTSAFNIDTANPQILSGEKKHFFGYKVLQFASGQERGVMVSEPLNGSGGICRFVQNKKLCFSPQETVSAKHFKHFGLSIAKEASPHPMFTACSPSLAHECHQNSYLNSRCFRFDSQFQRISNFTPAFQDCTKKIVNLAFLFDGSGSMTPQEFDKNKVFIKDIMNSLKNSSIKFAAVQFSSNPREVFNFNAYEEGRASEKLDKERFMATLTNTYSAMDYVMKNIFDNPQAGASPDATKVLVIITDGNPSDEDNNLIINKYNAKNIIRFVIGVKVNTKTLINLRAIASEPKLNNTFHINDYNGLTQILENFQKKIFNIEGTTTVLAESLVDEMSQSGFSAVYHKAALILGSVGSNNWRGALYELQGSDSEERKIMDPDLETSSYMGYSVATGEKNSEPLYFTGAPRFNHIGQVLFFTKQNNSWMVKQRVNGTQIGSYFGAELCAVDIDSDGNTDFLLVGAPLAHHQEGKTEGHVDVYAVTHEIELKSVTTVHVPSRGRFGTAVSSLRDLNGDDLRDVAIGAPLENDHRGAVYIYLGDEHRGLRSNYSQRIMAETIKSQLQFFGQAIDGQMDLSGDGLTDMAVGSRGDVVILSSRPVFNVTAHLRFQPLEISTDNIDCLSNRDETLPMVTLIACFGMAEATKSRPGELTTGVNISYMLDVDPKRAFFNNTDSRDRNPQFNVLLREEEICFNHSAYMPKCVTDLLSPIIIKLNFSQSESRKEGDILNTDGPTLAVVGVPFVSCVADLEVDFTFNTSALVVMNQNYFNVTVRLSNQGDDSYNTNLTFHYPPGLSFYLLELVKSTKSTSHSCDGLEDTTVCRINLPIYRRGSSATFKAVFHTKRTYDWNETMSMTITAQSDNQNSTRSMTKTIPVKFEIDLAVKVNENTSLYLDFTPEYDAPKTLVNVYEVINIGFKTVSPVIVTLTFPTTLEHNFEMKNYQVSEQQNKTQCRNISNTTSHYCSSDKSCKSIQCEGFILDTDNTAHFLLSAEVAFGDLKQRAKDMALLKQFTGDGEMVEFKSFVEVGYNTQRYDQASYEDMALLKQFTGDGEMVEVGYNTQRYDQVSYENGEGPPRFPQTQTDVRIEFIIPPNRNLIIGTGVGGGLLLLVIITAVMCKMGCFKKKRPQDREPGLHLEDAPGQGDASVPSDHTVAKADPPAEAKPLLAEGDRVNGCSVPVPGEEESDVKRDVTTVVVEPIAGRESESDCEGEPTP